MQVRKAYRTLALKYYQQIESDKVDFYMTMLNLAKEALTKGFSAPEDLDEFQESDEEVDDSRMLPGTKRLEEFCTVLCENCGVWRWSILSRFWRVFGFWDVRVNIHVNLERILN